MSKHKKNRMHFIPKVYLRQWSSLHAEKNSGEHCLYCYDYFEDEYYSNWGKEEIALNDKLFQDHRLYSQSFENELNKIENNYNRWIKDIDDFFLFFKNNFTRNIEEVLTHDSFGLFYQKLHNSCIRMLYFAFVQWIRYPAVQDRYFLFDIFKDLMMFDDTDYFEIILSEYLKLKNNNIIGFSYQDDKEIFRNPFNYFHLEKLRGFENNKYQLLLDHSVNGKFITSTNPVTPLFHTTDCVPYGFIFPLSPYYVLRVVEKEGILLFKDEDPPNCLWSLCTEYDETRMNITLLLNNPSSKLISYQKDYLKLLFKDIDNLKINEMRTIVTSKSNELYKRMHQNAEIINVED